MRSVPTKTTGDTLSAIEFNEGSQQELQNSILTSGQTLNAGDLNQLGKAMSIYGSAGDFYNDGGSANSYVLTPIGTRQSPPTLTDGVRVRFIAGNTNTGPSTINVNTIGNIALKENGVDVVSGRIRAGTVIEATFISVGSTFELTGVSADLVVNTVNTFGDALLFNGNIFNTKTLVTGGFSSPGVGSAVYSRDGTTGAASTGDVDDFFDASGIGWTRVDKLTRFGSFSVVIDTTNEFVRDTVLPEFTSRGIVAGLAVPLSSLHSSYVRMNLTDLHDYIRDNDGEILSHAINGIVLDASVELTYGESSIRTSKFELVKYGFSINAFVAITSVLDDKFKPELKKWYDYAFIRSTDGTNLQNSVNSPTDDVYNLNRVALENSVLQDLKDVASFAKNTFQNVTYITHDTLENLTATLDHAQTIGLTFELPSTWMARIHGLKKPMLPQPTENLITNSDFIKEDAADLAPIGWTLSSGTMTSLSSPVFPGDIATIDINGTAAAPDERLLFTHIYNSGDILVYTPFCFAINALSIDATNTKIRITMSARDSGSSVLTQSVKDFIIRGGNQRLFTELGVIPGGTDVSFIQVVVELISIAAGSVRAICDSPILIKSWTPEYFTKSKISPAFLKIRNNDATALAGGVERTLIFTALLVGNAVGTGYDDTTGKWTNSDGRRVDIKVHAGFQNMNADERLTIRLYRDAVLNEQVNISNREGATDVFGMLCATLVNDGSEYEIRILHDSAASRNPTVGFGSMLAMTTIAG